MFDKLLTNIALRTGSLETLREFQSRESRQRALRGFGVTFLCMALVIQAFAFVAPPQSQAAASTNDLIPNGFSSKSKLVSDCNANLHQIKTIYAWYGVSCKDISSSGVVKSLKSTEYNDKLYSVGHLPYGLPGETPVKVAGGTLYWRLLHGWDTGKYSTYRAVKVKSDNGKTFFILFQCGNLVSVGFPVHYTPPKPKPKPKTPPPQLCQYNSNLPANSPDCKPCSASTTAFDTFSCLTYGKTASNVTENIANANNTTVKAGDIIKYTLTVKNSAVAKVKDFTVQENLSDVLDYANTADLNGGQVKSNGLLTWPALDIPANGSVQKHFTVQIKNPIPKTAPAADDPQGFNGIMTNVYGSTVNIKVQQPTVVVASKTVATALPNTGPGMGIIIMSIIAILAGYFYARSRLILKESRIAQTLELGGGHE
jgi:uncharacterized repeat protein (TIGR01451 family)